MTLNFAHALPGAVPRRHRGQRAWVVLMLALASVPGGSAGAANDPAPADEAAQAAGRAPEQQQQEFFERRIRPILVERCQECHGPETQEAELRLDSRRALLAGSAAGPVIVPGKPEASRLIEVVGYQGRVQMPPDGKLSDEQIAALGEWIAQGAAWPEAADDRPTEPASEASAARFSDAYYDEVAREHWAFRPLAAGDPPQVADASWPRDVIDRYVLARLEASGLTPSPRAAPATLLRRLSYDLIGLPPTADEIAQFEADPSPEALEQLVDRLLARPEYGQRWGRLWLDVARYADTKGYVFTEDTRYPFSYTYRDWVIEAQNADLPYDQFVRWQLAADRYAAADDPRPLAGLGLLTVGSRFMHNVHDQIDDRIDVVTRGFLGLTVTCARCHDHKYDPIPMADYYALYGVFASSREPDELPLIAPAEVTAAYAEHRRRVDEARGQLDEFRSQQQGAVEEHLRRRAADYLVYIVERTAEAQETVEGDGMFSLGPDDLKPPAINRWRAWLRRSELDGDPVFGLWRRLAPLAADDFPERAAAIVAEADPQTNPLIRQALAAAPLESPSDVARRYGAVLAEAHAAAPGAPAAAPEPLAAAPAGAAPQPASAAGAAAASGEPTAPDRSDPGTAPDPGTSTAGAAIPSEVAAAAREQIRQRLAAEDSPTTVPHGELSGCLERTAAARLAELRRAVDQLQSQSPDEPARAMAMVDAPTPHETHIFLRGNPHRPGPAVPRRFLRIFGGPQQPEFRDGSGRKELAEAIVADGNPLTARVIVNRVWQWHFGQGLVETASDFGVRTPPPSHPELLDHLADWLKRDGWSLKRLHRRIVLSSTYAQQSLDRPECRQQDPENRLLWKFNRRRLEFEQLRDSLLMVAGRLDTSLGGRPVNLLAEPAVTRRAVYGFIDRQDLPGLYRSFDFPSPEASSPERPRTIVPQQALFLMNAPLVIEQARQAAARAGDGEPSQRVAALYRAVLMRQPSADETELALRFVRATTAEAAAHRAAGGTPTLAPWEQLAQVLLATNEFMYID